MAFGDFYESVKDPAGQWTDTPAYRDVRTHLKRYDQLIVMDAGMDTPSYMHHRMMLMEAPPYLTIE